MNQVILVGRLNEIQESNNRFQVLIIDKESTTPIEVIASNKIINQMSNYCKVNETIGIRGRITRDEENNQVVQALKVSFLSSSNKEINEEINK